MRAGGPAPLGYKRRAGPRPLSEGLSCGPGGLLWWRVWAFSPRFFFSIFILLPASGTLDLTLKLLCVYFGAMKS